MHHRALTLVWVQAFQYPYVADWLASSTEQPEQPIFAINNAHLHHARAYLTCHPACIAQQTQVERFPCSHYKHSSSTITKKVAQESLECVTCTTERLNKYAMELQIAALANIGPMTKYQDTGLSYNKLKDLIDVPDFLWHLLQYILHEGTEHLKMEHAKLIP